MYNDKLIVFKQEVIPTITNSIILVDFYQNIDNVINFTTDDIISKFEAFSNNKMDALYLT